MRVAVMLLGILALAGALWLLLGEREAPPPEDATLPVDDASRTPLPAPSLAGAPSKPTEAGSTGGFGVRGRVVTDQGEPMAGTTVVARRTPWTWNNTVEADFRVYFELDEHTPLTARTTTDANGRFHLTGLAWATYYEVLAAVAPPRTSSSQFVYRGYENRFVDLVVGPGVPLRGRVVDRTGQGISAVVHAQTASDHEGLRGFYPQVRTDAAGRFVFPAVQRGVLQVSAFVKGVGRVWTPDLRVPQEDELVIRFDVDGGATVKGVVRNTAGEPVMGARVAVLVETPSQLSYARVTTVGSDGSYSLSGFPEGAFEGVSVAAPGYVPRKDLAEGRPIAAGATETLDILLVREAVITGRVLSPDRKPIAGAHVAFIGPSQHGVTDHRQSGADGRYRIDKLAPVGRGRVIAAAPGFYQPPFDGPRLEWGGRGDRGHRVSIDAEGQRIEADLVLSHGIPVTGTVRTPEGRPVPGARVSFQREHDWRNYDPWTHVVGVDPLSADDEGHFEHPGLVPDTKWTLVASTDAWVGQAAKVQIGSKGPVAPVQLVVGPGASISGTVTYVTGGPAPHVDLYTGGHAAISDGSGRFHFERLAPGDHEISIQSGAHEDDTSSKRVKVAWGQVVEGVQMSVWPSRVLAGVVVDSEGNPIPGCPISYRVQADNVSSSTTNKTDGKGHFRFTGLADGLFQLWVPGMDEPFELDEPRTDVRLVTTARRVIVEGHVFAPDGSPAHGGEISLQVHNRADANIIAHESTAITDGSFRFQLLHAYEILVSVEHIVDALGRRVPFVDEKARAFDPSSAEPLEFRLRAGAKLEGVVVDEAGAPVAGAIVAALARERSEFAFFFLSHGAGNRQMRTGEDGSFSFEGTKDDEKLKVWVRPPARFATPESTTVEPGSTNVRVVLRPSVSIAGSVLAPDGTALSGVSVSATHASGNWPQFDATSGPNGTFRIEGLHPDREYTVKADNHRAAEVDFRSRLVAGIAAGREGVELRLWPGARVSGTVVTEDGSSVPSGCEVILTPLAEDRNSGGARENPEEDGTFVIGPVAPGEFQISVSGRDKWGTSVPRSLRLPAKDVRLVLPLGYPIRGKVEGLRESGFQVSAIVNGKRVSDIRVNEAGTFLISQDKPSVATLFVHKDDDPRYGVKDGVVGRSEVTLTLQEGRTIEGRVVGMTVDAGTRIHATRDGMIVSTTINEDGTYRIQGVPDGAWTVYVYDSKLQPQQGVLAGARNVILNIAPPDAPRMELPEPPCESCASCGSCGSEGAS